MGRSQGEGKKSFRVSTRQDVMWIYIFTIFCKTHIIAISVFAGLPFASLRSRMSIQRAYTQEGISNRELETYSRFYG